MLSTTGNARNPRQRKNMENVLPKMLPGTLHPQWVRCGRENCRCAHGELHGPYYYRFFREGGRLKKRYVKQSDVETVSIACLATHVQKRRIVEARRIGERREQAGRAEWRGLLKLIKQLSRGEP